MLVLLTLHLVLAAAAPALVSWWGRRAYLVLALGPAAAAVWALTYTGEVMAGRGPVESVTWVPSLGLELAFRLDTLSWLMVLLVGGIGALVLVYSSGYFSASGSGLGRFGGVLTGFAGSMLGLVTTDNLLMLYVFWELTTVFSYVLIGHYADRKPSRRAAMQAIIVTTAGGLAMLVGMILIGSQAGTFRISEVIAMAPQGPAITVAIVLLIAAAATKSALVPFHFWLPAAMAAPTPVSAYLHAAAMVKAGVYLVARFAPAYASNDVWHGMIVALGCATLLIGGYRALRQHDLKLILAYGTVSQLGLLVLLVGLGTKEAALAGLAMLGAHAMYKATLFLSVGAVDAATGTRDLRVLNGVGRRMPVVAAAAGLATASMIGLPPFTGYVAKEAALAAALDGEGGWVDTVVLVAVVLGSILTVAYGLRLWWGAFATKRLAAGQQAPEPTPVRRVSPLLIGPPAVLGVLGLALALVPQVGDRVLAPHAEAYLAGEVGHLTLWAGFGAPLLLTAVILAVGAGLFVARDAVEAAQDRLFPVLDADRTYRTLMRRLDDVAADVTGFTQRGSLPFYLGGILVVLIVLPGGWLFTHSGLPQDWRWFDNPAQMLPAGLIIAAAVLAMRARRRLKAVLLAGVTGYGTAILYLLHGAPDLALTQVLVETVTIVVFVLVLRRLPLYFSNRPLAADRWLRLAIGLAVGVTVAAFALVAPGTRIHAPASATFAEEAVEFGGGRNIVNVTLVDIRAWDTMGEISVLLVAATGVASLVFLRRRTGDILRTQDFTGQHGVVWGGTPDPMAALRRQGVDAPTESHGAYVEVGASSAGSIMVPPALAKRAAESREWLTAGRTLAPQRRSVILEVATRLLFPTMVVYAVFLLFSGHNAPGGGFAAGLVVGIALIVRYLAGGRYELGEAAPVHPGVLLGTGLTLSAGMGLVTMIAGRSVLESVIVDITVPLVGEVHLVTSLFFDVGVFLVVIGLVLDILRSLGAEIDRQAEQRPAREESEEAVPR